MPECGRDATAARTPSLPALPRAPPAQFSPLPLCASPSASVGGRAPQLGTHPEPQLLDQLQPATTFTFGMHGGFSFFGSGALKIVRLLRPRPGIDVNPRTPKKEGKES